MFLNRFYSEKNGLVRISADQASNFAKDISGDFNSIHDPGNRSYCVPGDLLFALVLTKYGLSRRMRFTFTGMVRDGAELIFPDLPGDQFAITDQKGKSYLQVERNGETSSNAHLIEKLTRNYVAFSGQNFPHILVPLMAEHQVMINPARPLIIYDSMSFAFDHLTVTEPRLDLTETTLEITGKRAEARLYFQIYEDDQPIGTGLKKLILSGLRPYEEATIQKLSEVYLTRRDAYRSAP
ncbi:MAG: DUF3581 domain-containing protein [Candidatus Marinimicrobia bacterium]|nr:DUF3581 domain-containing protein [Candidatus Neomarinimicrobiota bacterium]